MCLDFLLVAAYTGRSVPLSLGAGGFGAPSVPRAGHVVLGTAQTPSTAKLRLHVPKKSKKKPEF